MARIRIDDLPVTETLTAEQEALIEGAGLRSFKPSFEALEDRQMMSANPIGALAQLKQPVLGPAQDRQLTGANNFAPTAGPRLSTSAQRNNILVFNAPFKLD